FVLSDIGRERSVSERVEERIIERSRQVQSAGTLHIYCGYFSAEIFCKLNATALSELFARTHQSTNRMGVYRLQHENFLVAIAKQQPALFHFAVINHESGL